MITTEKDIKLTRGDSFGFNFSVTNANDEAVTLNSCYFSVKESPTDNEYIFQKRLNGGITQLENGEYYVKIEPADTRELPEAQYYYDLECGINNDVFTFLKGKLDIKWDVTKE